MLERKRHVLGIDIGGTNIRMGLVNDSYHLSSFKIYKTDETLSNCDVVKKLAEMIDKYCIEENGGVIPQAMSIGFPSTIDTTRKIVISTPNIAGFPEQLEIVDSLSKKIDTKVYINRDVNNLMQYDLEVFKLRDCQNVLGFYLGTGLGNAIYLNGQFLLGRNGVAAELGHIPFYGIDKICGCGNVGCVETVASGLALEQLKKEKYPAISIKDIFSNCMQKEDVLHFVDTLAYPIATEINIFDPTCIVLGGGVIFMQDFPNDILVSSIKKRLRKPYPAENLNIIYSEPKQENGVIGAAIYGWQMLKGDK